MISMIDVYIKLHFQYTTVGHVIKDRTKTSFFYLKHNFFLDFIGSFPLDLLLKTFASNKLTLEQELLLGAVEILKLVKILKVFSFVLLKYTDCISF